MLTRLPVFSRQTSVAQWTDEQSTVGYVDVGSIPNPNNGQWGRLNVPHAYIHDYTNSITQLQKKRFTHLNLLSRRSCYHKVNVWFWDLLPIKRPSTLGLNLPRVKGRLIVNYPQNHTFTYKYYISVILTNQCKTSTFQGDKKHFVRYIVSRVQ